MNPGTGVQVYLWTMAQREGTPCVPVILAMLCNNEGACSGLGDRLISLGTAFWLVHRFQWLMACVHGSLIWLAIDSMLRQERISQNSCARHRSSDDGIWSVAAHQAWPKSPHYLDRVQEWDLVCIAYSVCNNSMHASRS